MFTRVEPIVNHEVVSLCARPYPNHPHGCPNYAARNTCPPRVNFFDDLYQMWPVWAIFNVFDFAGHVEKMKAKHPDWTRRQLECCLYWQPKARASLEHAIYGFELTHPGFEIVRTPEALGVDVTATMAKANVRLEWPPVKYTYQVALAARKR